MARKASNKKDINLKKETPRTKSIKAEHAKRRNMHKEKVMKKGKGMGKKHLDRRIQRVGLLDLSSEIIARIAQFAERRYPLMMTCKRTLVEAGKVLYDTELPSTSLGKKGLLNGLEHDKPTKRIPFGRNLKLAFLPSARDIYFDPNGEGLPDHNINCPNSIVIDLFGKLSNIDMVIFNGVHLKMGAAAGSSPKQVEAIRALGLVTHPRSVTADMCRPRNSYDSFSYPSVRFAQPPRKETVITEETHSGYWFSPANLNGLHSPEVIQHQSLEVRNRDPDRPIVCYGSLNRVDMYGNHESHTPVVVCRFLIGIIQAAHPELNSWSRAVLSKAEQQIRDRTKWEFTFERCVKVDCRCGLGEEVVTSQVVQQMERDVPKMKGRTNLVEKEKSSRSK